MHQFDGAVITTALPSMAESLHEDPLKLNLAITCYLLALAVFVPISGWMADRWGAKRVFTAAIVLFTTSSVLCGFSDSLLQLIVLRTMQGIGGAMMTPVGRVIVVKSVPKSELVRAMNYITIPAVLGPVLGPSVGGFIVTYFSWPVIFFINLPIGLIGIVLVWIYIPDIKEEDVPRLDLRGFILISTALAALVFGFSALGRNVISNTIILVAIACGVVCATLYLMHARRKTDAIIDLSLLRVQTFRVAVTGGSLFYLGTTSQVFLLALLLQLGFGMSAFHAGLITLGNAAGSVLMRFTFQQILKFFGFRTLLVGTAILMGLILISCGFFTPATPIALMMAILVVSGFCRSTQFTAVQSIGYADLTTPQTRRATSFAAMLQQLSQSVGVGLSAGVVHLSLLWHGRTDVSPADVALGFFVIGACSLSSCLVFYRLPHDAGMQLSGRRPRV
jgi:EmrB/QacA subfamily drug resistance transporter